MRDSCSAAMARANQLLRRDRRATADGERLSVDIGLAPSMPSSERQPGHCLAWPSILQCNIVPLGDAKNPRARIAPPTTPHDIDVSHERRDAKESLRSSRHGGILLH